MGTPNIPAPFLQIWSSGPNGAAENGTNDDELLGVGGTDASGEFVSSPGIAIDRPLRAGEMVYALDLANGLTGPAALVTGPPALPVGELCSEPTDCELGFCADGFCCDQECSGTRQACNSPGREGQCLAVSTPAPALSGSGRLITVVALVLVGLWAMARRRRRAT